jgi:hypothetical protein
MFHWMWGEVLREGCKLIGQISARFSKGTKVGRPAREPNQIFQIGIQREHDCQFQSCIQRERGPVVTIGEIDFHEKRWTEGRVGINQML